MVNHPDHYNNHPSGVEAIDVCEHLSFNLGNAFKYLYRAQYKFNVVEDLKKAIWYLERESSVNQKYDYTGDQPIIRTASYFVQILKTEQNKDMLLIFNFIWDYLCARAENEVEPFVSTFIENAIRIIEDLINNAEKS